MITTADFKKGLRVEIDDQPWTIVTTNSQSPSARGAATLIKVRLRNVLTGQISDRTYKAGEKFGEPDLQFRAAQYLYSVPEGDGQLHHFMDAVSYEQFERRDDDLGCDPRYLAEGLEVKAVVFNERVCGVELPQFVEAELSDVAPGTRGDTASGGGTTAATTTTGLTVQVPLYVKAGDRIRIDTTSGDFKDRIG